MNYATYADFYVVTRGNDTRCITSPWMTQRVFQNASRVEAAWRGLPGRDYFTYELLKDGVVGPWFPEQRWREQGRKPVTPWRYERNSWRRTFTGRGWGSHA